MNLQEQIARIKSMMGINEVYDPSGTRHIPSKYVYHKSNPIWRKNIYEVGLLVSVGDCYSTYSRNFTDEECKPAIFATDSENENYWYQSTWDDDIWMIDTECANVNWYKDMHYKSSEDNYHIVTFENISSDCIKLIYEGTGENN